MKFYIKDNIVYKEITSHETPYLLKMSPWQNREDRRLFNFNIEDYKSIKENKARELINKQWDEDEREWEFEGNIYRVYNSLETEFKTTYDKVQNIKGIKEYSFTIGDLGIPIRYHLCIFQGKLYWIIINGYYPQAQLYNFTNINTKPDKFALWVNVKHCKIVYKLVYKNNINQYESI